MPIMTVPGVLSIVGFGKDPAPIPDQEIDAIDTVLRSGFAAEPCPAPREGQPIRVRFGPLAGVEGILLKKKNDYRLIVSLIMLQRAISVELDRESIAPV